MKRLLIVLAVVALLTTAAAAPVAATGGTRHGDVDITLYLTPCSESDPESPFLTWAGTVDFGKRTLGIAYFPIGDLEDLGDGWVYFEEEWTLFWLPWGELTDEKLIAAACNPRRELLRGEDSGIGTPMGTALGAGHATWARGWWHKYVGGESFWSGAYTSEAGDRFTSLLWLVPGNIR